jgi:6-phosphogluconolactonase
MNKDRAHVFVGSYTPPLGNDAGIYGFELDANGVLRPLGITVGVHSPTYLAVGPAGLYATIRRDAGRAGLAGYAFTGDGAGLRLTGTATIGQQALCYVRPSLSGRCALAASFTGGTVALFPLDAAGRPGPVACEVGHEGHGPVPGRQDRPHPHSIVPAPGGRFALVPDLGTDRIVVYRLDSDLRLVRHAETAAAPGSGPRHLVFHPGGRYALVSNELDSTVSSYSWDGERGVLQPLHTARTVPASAAGQNRPADIHAHPSGRWVYVSNRGHDSIAQFAVDPQTGRLEYVGFAPTQGAWPRCFAIDPAGRWLLAANQRSGSLACFSVNQATGALLAAGPPVPVPDPACVVITAGAGVS